MDRTERDTSERSAHHRASAAPTSEARDAVERRPRLFVNIPCLNEEATIADVIGRIPRDIAGIGEVHALVIDDGSTDGTAALARQAGAHVVSHRANQGVGAAFGTGMDAALARGADIIVTMDGDGQFNPADIPELVRPLLDGRADFVSCTRFARADYLPAMPKVKIWGNRLMCRIVNRITGMKFTDVSCGFRAFTRETALKLNLQGRFTYTQETFIDLATKEVAMAEVPLKVRGERKHGKSRVASSLWNYGARALMIIIRSARDMHPLSFFGLVAASLIGLGAVLGLFVFGWWLHTGRTTPFRSVLIGSGTAFTLGFLSGVLALLADMLGRIRKTQEQLLMMCRHLWFGPNGPGSVALPPRREGPDGDQGENPAE